MKTKHPVLEYSVAENEPGKKGKWFFTFRTAAGNTVVESPRIFMSKEAAEKGFVSFIKSVALNDYKVEFAGPSSSRVRVLPRFHRRGNVLSSRRSRRQTSLRIGSGSGKRG